MFLIGFSKEDLEGLTEFLELSCVVGTWDQYKKPWENWVEYLGQIKGPGMNNPTLDGVEYFDKVIRVVLFIKHLYENGARKTKVDSILSALSTKMQSLFRDSSMFGDAIVKRAKKGTIGTNDEIAAMNQDKLSNPTMPMALDMVMQGRLRFWLGQNWDAKGMNARAAWICMALGFNFGARIGHLTRARGKARPKKGVVPDPNAKPARSSPDHCLRCRNMKFYVKQKGTNALAIVLGGEEIRDFLGCNTKGQSDAVEFVELVFLTSKTVRKVVTNVVNVKKVGRSTPEETILLQDLCEWMVHAKPKVDDEITCRYAQREQGKARIDRKVITAAEVNWAIKALAVYLKLPPEMFSSRSLRSGLASHLTAQGVSTEVRNHIGNWTEKSRVVDNHYAHKAASGGAFAGDLEGPGVWSMEEVKHMVTQRKGL